MRKLNLRKLGLMVLDLLLLVFVYYAMITLVASRLSSADKLLNCGVMAACIMISRVGFRVYSNVWRYANTSVYLWLIIADIVGCGVYGLVSRIWIAHYIRLWHCISTVCVTTLATISGRYIWQGLLARRDRMSKRNVSQQNRVNVGIVGAGSVGVLLAEELLLNKRAHYRPYCFFDKDTNKVGESVSGIKVYPEDEHVVEFIRKHPIQEIVIALPDLDTDHRKRLFDLYKQTGLPVKLYDFALGSESGKREMRAIRIEDLLFRKSVDFDQGPKHAFYQGKTVLVSGGGGSIGSEICRQLAELDVKKLAILDIYENNAYDIQQELIRKYGRKLPLEVYIASVRDKKRLEEVFDQVRPDVVVHAAAHKHVPLMEHSCQEAIKNNVFGTLNMVELAEKYAVKRFVMISTDKAVNPTNIMGASKRLCEMIVQSRKDSKTDFIAVRFGNVLGSNGSVIPLFKRQIENGGPVTITDKRIIRYFMTIPEAANLVLQTGVGAGKGEIYVLDMGKPVRMLELAENMIRLSGYTPYEDIDIVEIGLREGEKLYEELLMRTEELDKTDNERIFIERDRALSRKEIDEKLVRLQKALDEGGAEAARRAVIAEVPTFKDPDELNRHAAEAEEVKAAGEAV